MWWFNRIEAQLTRIEHRLINLTREIRKASYMSQTDINKLKTAVEKNTTVSQSAVTLIAGLAQQIRDAADDPEELQQLASQIEAQATMLADAITANTPQAPQPA